jgi:hypothetical protein
MRKIILAGGAFLLIHAFLNAGYSSTKGNTSTASPIKHSSQAKDQFLSAPRTAPVLVPLPNQQVQASTPNSQSQQSTPTIPSKTSVAGSKDTSAASSQSPTNQSATQSDCTNNCPAAGTPPPANTTPPADSCNPSRSNNTSTAPTDPIAQPTC